MGFDPLTGGYGGGWLWGKDGGGGGSKAAAHSADVSSQGQEFIDIINRYLSQLAPGSEEYNQLMAFGDKYLSQIEQGAIPVSELGGVSLDQQPAATQYGSQLVSQQQKRIASGGAATPLEARTNQAFEGLRTASANDPFEQDLLNALNGLSTTTPEGTVFGNAINRAANPVQDDSVFKNMLKLVEDQVNTSAAGRGILGGGLRLEQMGRAGTEAAVAEAKRQDALRQESYTNALGLYGQGENLRNRKIGVEGDLVNLQLGRESNLTGLLNANANTRLNNQNTLLANRNDQSIATLLDALDSQAAQRAGVGKAVGSTIGAVGGAVVGGPAGAVAGSQIGGQVGTQLTPGQIQTSQQTQNLGTTQPLSRQGSSGSLDLAALLKALQDAGAMN